MACWIHVLLIGMFSAGGYLIWDSYREQLYAYLPYLILLLCPLMHIFMHKGHGGHENHDDNIKRRE